jgi:hypothetical protein
MSGQGHHIFADGLARLAARTAAPGLGALSRRVGGPVTVAVHGRGGVGVSTVTAALSCAALTVGTDGADVDVRVIAEAAKPEDLAAVVDAPRPTVVVFNKADLTGFTAGGPLEAAAAGVRTWPSAPMSRSSPWWRCWRWPVWIGRWLTTTCSTRCGCWQPSPPT